MNWYSETVDGLIINVKAQPRSSKPGVDGLIGDALKVKLRSSPVEGKANKELAEVIAVAFNVAKSAVVFKSGETSKTKRLLVRGITAASIPKGLV